MYLKLISCLIKKLGSTWVPLNGKKKNDLNITGIVVLNKILHYINFLKPKTLMYLN